MSLCSLRSRSSLTWRLAQAPPLELWRESIDLGQLRRPWAAREATRATGAEPFAILAAEGITLHRERLRFLGSVLLLLCSNQLKVARVGHLVSYYARRMGLGGMRMEYRGKSKQKGLQWCAKAYDQGWRAPPSRLGNFNTRSAAALACAKFAHHGREGDQGSDAWRAKCQSVREHNRKKLGLPTWHRSVPRTEVAAAELLESPNRQLAAGDETVEQDEPSPPAEPLTSPEAEAAEDMSGASGAGNLIAAMFA